MTADIGAGRWRIGSKEERERLLSVRISDEQAAALTKLRTFKGIGKSEVVDLALEMLLSMSADDIARRVEERRSRSN